jgi:hypothetical protein
MTTAVQPVFTFDEASHTYTDDRGIVVPSVTQMLKSEGFINFDGIPFGVLERKRRIGNLVHQATHRWEDGEDLNDYDLPEVVMPYIKGYINFCNDNNFQPDLCEKRSLAVVNGMRFGMTPDRRGEVKGIPTIVELKSSACEHPAWRLQLALYDMGLTGLAKPTCERAGLQLGPKLPRNYKYFPYENAKYRGDYTVALNALANDIWKRNEKIADYDLVPERIF